MSSAVEHSPADVVEPSADPSIDLDLPPYRRPLMDYQTIRVPLATVPFIIGLVLWQVISTRKIDIFKYALATPHQAVTALRSDLSSSPMYHAIWVTMQEFLLGIGIGAATGIVFGILLALVPILHTMTWPAVVFFQSVPKLALAPLLLLIFGFGIASKAAVASSIAFFPVLVGVIEGLHSTRHDEMELMTSLTASRWQRFFTIRVPRAIPATFGGFQVGAVFALMSAVVTEFLGASAGLGYLIQLRSTQLQTGGVFSALIVLSVIGVAVGLILSTVGARLSRWEE